MLPAPLALSLVLAVIALAALLGRCWILYPAETQRVGGRVFRLLRRLLVLPLSYLFVVVLLIGSIPIALVFVTLKMIRGEKASVRVKLA